MGRGSLSAGVFTFSQVPWHAAPTWVASDQRSIAARKSFMVGVISLVSVVVLLAEGTIWPVLAQAAPAAAPQGEGGIFDSLISSPILPIMAVVMVFYFIMLRPDQKKRKEQESLLAGLKVNDHVVTIGGIAGTVVNVTAGAKFVTIRVDDKTNTRLKVLRTAISRVGTLEELAEDEKTTS